MLIEKIIEFKWRGPRPPDRTCTPITAYFHTKTKISEKTSSSGILFTAKILQEAM